MKAVIQRVSRAAVRVDGEEIGAISHGVLAYIGIGHDDTIETGKKLIDKILTYRIFENKEDAAKAGKLDLNVTQVGGGLLLVPQFTLMANTNSGRRPDFGGAMQPDLAKALFIELVDYANANFDRVATGQFGADMKVDNINDGPLTFLLEV